MANGSLQLLNRRIDEILADNESGSSVLLHNLQTAFIAFGREGDGSKSPAVMPVVRKCSRQLRDFQLIQHFLLELQKLLEGEDFGKGSILAGWIHEYVKRWEDAQTEMFVHAREAFQWKGASVATLSHSGTVLSFLQSLQKVEQPARVIQAESRPMLEGRKQATLLAQSGFSVDLVSDMQAARLVEDADILLLGADRVFDDCFVNKTGSFALSLAANHFNKCVMVLADSRKFVSGVAGDKPVGSNNDPSEIWDGANDGIRVTNNYLESTPFSLVSMLVNENGVYSI